MNRIKFVVCFQSGRTLESDEICRDDDPEGFDREMPKIVEVVNQVAIADKFVIPVEGRPVSVNPNMIEYIKIISE